MIRLGSIVFLIITSIAYKCFASDTPIKNGLVNVVTSCTWYNHGYIKLPGFQTCLKLGGELKGDVISDNLMKADNRNFTDTAAYIESRLLFDTKTQVEMFELSTFSGIKYIWNQDSSTGTIEADRAAVQFSNAGFSLMAGIDQSLYTGFIGYSLLNLAGEPWSDNTPLQITLKIPAGPFNFGFSIEDVVYDDVTPDEFYYNERPRTETKNDYAFVGVIEYLSELIDVKVSGAVMDVSDTGYFVAMANTQNGEMSMQNILQEKASSYNYAFNINTEIRPSDNLKFTIGAQMGAGAMGYTGLDVTNYKTPEFDFAGTNPLPLPDAISSAFLNNDVSGFRDALMNSAAATSYTLMGGLELHVLQNVFFGFDASYQSFDLDEQGITASGTGFTAGSSVIWKPTSNLNVLFSAGYSSYNLEGTLPARDHQLLNITNDTDNLKFGTRLKYVFAPDFPERFN